MQRKDIHKLVESFFNKEHPKEIQEKFRLWFLRENHQQEKDEVMEDIWNELPVITTLSSVDELKRINKRIYPRTRQLYYRVAAIAAIVILPLLAFFTTKWYYQQPEMPQDIAMVECFVPNGERKQITLPDGSTVWLNSGSILLYPEIFANDRTMYLSGEGNFNVMKDPEKPFVVRTNYLNVEALGTVFNVNSYPDIDKTTTILQSGKVKVEHKNGIAAPVILNPNEQLVYNHNDSSFVKTNVDATHLSKWIDGYLIFQQEPLANIFHSLERRYDVKISYTHNKLAETTFTVRFHEEETLEEALNVLRKIGAKFRYTITDNDVYIR